MKKAIIIGFICIISNCCTKINESEQLSISKTPYMGDELRIDGFYYQKWDNDTRFCDITFLYNNGVVFQRGGSGDLSELSDCASQSYFSNDVMDKKAFWGLFHIENDSIIYEYWSGTELGYIVYREEGKIINDTTFLMTEQSQMKQGDKTETRPIEWIYYFEHFSPKPDSINSVIPN